MDLSEFVGIDVMVVCERVAAYDDSNEEGGGKVLRFLRKKRRKIS